MKIYTRRGDDGTTSLLYGGRVSKDDPIVEACGDVDEAQAAIGMARSYAEPDSELDGLLRGVERDLWVLMAELSTSSEHRERLVAEQTLVTAEMVQRLESLIDDTIGRFEPLTGFVVPGQTHVSGCLDLARTVVRRSERRALKVAVDGSHVVAYLNRLSDLLWTIARWQDHGSLLVRSVPPKKEPSD